MCSFIDSARCLTLGYHTEWAMLDQTQAHFGEQRDEILRGNMAMAVMKMRG